MSRNPPMIRGKTPALLVTLVTLLAAGEAAAQSLRYLNLGTWEGSVQADYGLGQDQISSDTTPSSSFSQRNAGETFSVRNSGFSVLDPDLLTGSLGLTLGLTQDNENSAGIISKGRSKLLGYSFDADILNVLPYGGALFANRSRSTSFQPFGRVDTTSSNRGLSLRLNEGSPLRDMGFPYLSANLQLEQQRIQEISSSALGQSYQHSEVRNSLSQQGHKGSENSDLDWHYDLNEVQDPSFSSGNYRSRSANLGYSQDFGAALNRRWDSRLAYYNRVGSTSMSQFSMGEHLHLAHWSNLATDYSYQLSRLQTEAFLPSLSQSGAFSVQYQPYQNLNSYASAQRQLQPAGQIDAYAGGLSYHYQHPLPWQGVLTLGSSGSYQLVDTHIFATQANITDEAQVAPQQNAPLGTGFLLNQAYVAAASIVVVDNRDGLRLPTVAGVDYLVVPQGSQTLIVPQLTVNGIRANDPLEVSYTYAIPPSMKYATTAKSASAGMNFHWISFAVAHSESAVTLLSGNGSGFLQSSRNDRAQVDVNGHWQKLQGTAGAAFERSEATLLSYTQQRYYQSATYQYSRNLGLALNTDWTVANYQMPARTSDTRGVNLTANWYAPGGWIVNALAGRRYLTDSAQPSETVSNEGLRAQMKYGKLSFTSAFTANQRIRGGSRMSNWRIDFSVTREL